MLSIWTFLTTTRLGRAIGIALLCAIVAGGFYWRGHRAGFQSGHVTGGKEALDSLRADMEAERTVLRDNVRKLNGEIELKDKTIAVQVALLARYDSRIAALETEREEARTRIARLTDTEVLLDLARQLKVRAPDDVTPALYPTEIRRADEIVADYGHLTEKVGQLEGKIQAQAVQVQAITEKQELTERKFEAALEYIDRADARFSKAYNIFQTVHPRPLWQRVLSFGLLRTKKITTFEPILPPEKPKELSQ